MIRGDVYLGLVGDRHVAINTHYQQFDGGKSRNSFASTK
jgi:hypothetical protein